MSLRPGPRVTDLEEVQLKADDPQGALKRSNNDCHHYSVILARRRASDNLGKTSRRSTLWWKFGFVWIGVLLFTASGTSSKATQLSVACGIHSHLFKGSVVANQYWITRYVPIEYGGYSSIERITVGR